MRVEAHSGPRPIRKVAFGNPIVAWRCSDAPRVQGSPEFQHVTMFYLNDGDAAIPQAQKLLDQYAQPRMFEVPAPLSMDPDANGNPIIWLTLADTFSNYAALLLNKFTKAGLRASQDRSNGEALSHITIARPPRGDQGTRILQQIQGQYSGTVTLDGPIIFNAAGQPMERTRTAHVSSMIDVVIDMLELS